MEWWHHSTGLTLLRWSVYLGIAGLLASLVATVLSSTSGGWGIRRAVGCLLVLSVFLALPLSHWWSARTLPVLNDVTTDVADPPSFREAPDLREPDQNSVEPPEQEELQQQLTVYSGVRPLRLEADPRRVFDRVAYTTRVLGWEVVNEDPEEGILEAVDRTFWFGFTDDVVVRIRDLNGGSRIDVRSSSRVGRHDLGRNARRILRFLRQLEQHSGESASYLDPGELPGS